jgi:hypothetical protein
MKSSVLMPSPSWSARFSSGCSARKATARSGRRELLGEGDDDQRQAGGDAQREDGLRRVGQRELPGGTPLVVGRPAAGADDEDEHREAEQVDALQDGPEAELEHADGTRGDQQPCGLPRAVAGGHADGDDGHDGAEQDAGHVGLQVHGGRQVEPEREQADERDRQVQADRERHVRREPRDDGHVDAVAPPRDQATTTVSSTAAASRASVAPSAAKPQSVGNAPSSNQVSWASGRVMPSASDARPDRSSEQRRRPLRVSTEDRLRCLNAARARERARRAPAAAAAPGRPVPGRPASSSRASLDELLETAAS